MNKLPQQQASLSRDVLRIVNTLAVELHPHRARVAEGDLDSDLDDAFGLDSLGRMELIARLERAYNIQLPERLFTEARTPRDLLKVVETAGLTAPAASSHAIEDRAAAGAEVAPRDLQSLNEVLSWHAAKHPERDHIFLSDGDREEPAITFAELDRRARAVAAGLQQLGIEGGDRVALMLLTDAAFFSAFLGTLYAGAIPVPIYPPWRLHKLEDHMMRQVRILEDSGVVALITFQRARRLGTLLKAHVPKLRHVATVDDIIEDPDRAVIIPRSADDIAFLQYTSGSTGDPKGVMLSHANILANVRGIGVAMGARSNDVMVSWLPLYHNMGLIVTWLASLVHAVPFVIMSPLHFLARPERWFWTMHRNRATISVAPNFAYELCHSSIAEEKLEGLDLSALRVLGNGSELVSPRSVRDFFERFKPYGLKPDIMLSCYGLAESSAALTVPPLGRPFRVDAVSRSALAEKGRADPAQPGDQDTQEIVSCGPPLIGHEVRIAGPDNRELPERREGRLQFKGPSSTKGYFGDQEKTRALFSDGWLESGDLAYMAEGEIYITGRTKDIIVRAGRNIHPGDVESAICGLPGVESNGALLFGAPEAARGTERLVLMIETQLRDETERQDLIKRAEALASDILELPPDDVVLVPPNTIPHTDSGKVKRLALRESYVKGEVGGEGLSPQAQLRRLQMSAVTGSLRRALRDVGDWLYARYWWGMMWAFGIVVWPLVVLLPRSAWRWAVMRWASGAVLKVLGHRLTVTREAPFPEGPAVYVANHASYLDHLPIIALVPGKLSFAAKGDLEGRFVQGIFLKKLGTLFVDRFDAEAGIANTERALSLARQGRNLVFYPEATATRLPGLLDFRMGAFVVAAKAGLPVVPITLRGTRSILRQEERWFPRRGEIALHIGQPILPEGDDFDAALKLKNAARESILTHCREPDLAAEKPQY